MKRHHWLILIVISLLGMLFIPKTAYSADFRVIESIRPVLPIQPVILPVRPLPMPSAIPGPLVNLPSPSIPLVSIPGTIVVRPFVVARGDAKGFFPQAQKMFAGSADGKGPSEGQLNAGFDSGAKTAPAVEADGTVKPGTVVITPKKDEKKKRVERPRVIQVPTWELEREIGI